MGNYTEMLNIKRRKAETKLIKLRIIKKIYEGKGLNKIEEVYRSEWMKALNSANLMSICYN